MISGPEDVSDNRPTHSESDKDSENVKVDRTFVGDVNTDVIDYEDHTVMVSGGDNNDDGGMMESETEVAGIEAPSSPARSDVADTVIGVRKEDTGIEGCFDWVYMTWSECSASCGQGNNLGFSPCDFMPTFF